MPSRLSRPRLPRAMGVVLAAVAVLVSALPGLLGHSTLANQSSSTVKSAAGPVSRESSAAASRRAAIAATGAQSTTASARAGDSGRSTTSGPGPVAAVAAALLFLLLVGRLVGSPRGRIAVRGTGPAVVNNRAPPARVVFA